MKRIYIRITLFISLVFGCLSCETLDVPPPNIMTNEVILSNPQGVKAYMATLYSRLPIEDFKYSARNQQDGRGFNTWNNIWSLSVSTGENANRNTGNYESPANDWWSDGYLVIRYANNLIEQLPKQTSLKPDDISRWVGEAYFIRAFTYYALAKRYGGVPLVTEVQDFSGTNADELFVQRSSEEASFDLIKSDLDSAINKLGATSESAGRANKYVVAAFKSRAMIYAGSIARYAVPYSVGGVMLNGIPSEKAASYFKEAFLAAKMCEGQYSLYMKDWVANDRDAIANNYAALFLAEESPENIFIKGYNYPDAYHSWDHLYNPTHLTSGGGDRYCPTLDWVEMFDGLPKNAKGQLVTTDVSGSYIVYGSRTEVFENAEGRLWGSLLLAGAKRKTGTVDIRRGIFKEDVDPSVPIAKFFPDDAKNAYSANDFYKNNVVESSQANAGGQTAYELSNGKLIYPCGLDGVSSAKGYSGVTGFQGRKYLQDPTEKILMHKSTQSWIEIRYAEVLLNRAEAALELYQAGESVSGTADLQQDAFTCINEIRTRAGANLLASKADLSSDPALTLAEGGYMVAPNRGLQLIRIERKKELHMENKIFWDMKRWRTFDIEVNARVWRVCMPFLFAQGANPTAIDEVEGKWILDCRFDERNRTFTFPVSQYTETIPGSEITKGLYPNPGN